MLSIKQTNDAQKQNLIFVNKGKRDIVTHKIVAFVPIRLGSKRIPSKSVKFLGEKPLINYVLNTLLKIRLINNVFVYCSDESIIQYLSPGIDFLKRDHKLDSDDTLGIDIYRSFSEMIKADYYILVHATSPFLKNSSIEISLNKILTEGYDSAFSVLKYKTFVWYQQKPLNYRLDSVIQTQFIEPIYIETSSFYIFSREILSRNRRIGDNPYLHLVDPIEGLDIDYPDDFALAEKYLKLGEFRSG